jgi:hypothetical protein
MLAAWERLDSSQHHSQANLAVPARKVAASAAPLARISENRWVGRDQAIGFEIGVMDASPVSS